MDNAGDAGDAGAVDRKTSESSNTWPNCSLTANPFAHSLIAHAALPLQTRRQKQSDLGLRKTFKNPRISPTSSQAACLPDFAVFVLPRGSASLLLALESFAHLFLPAVAALAALAAVAVLAASALASFVLLAGFGASRVSFAMSGILLQPSSLQPGALSCDEVKRRTAANNKECQTTERVLVCGHGVRSASSCRSRRGESPRSVVKFLGQAHWETNPGLLAPFCCGHVLHLLRAQNNADEPCVWPVAIGFPQLRFLLFKYRHMVAPHSVASKWPHREAWCRIHSWAPLLAASVRRSQGRCLVVCPRSGEALCGQGEAHVGIASAEFYGEIL